MSSTNGRMCPLTIVVSRSTSAGCAATGRRALAGFGLTVGQRRGVLVLAMDEGYERSSTPSSFSSAGLHAARRTRIGLHRSSAVTSRRGLEGADLGGSGRSGNTLASYHELDKRQDQQYGELLEKIGVRALKMDRNAMTHLRVDQPCAADDLHRAGRVAGGEFGDSPDLQAIGGRALREMTRIARQSAIPMWRDIAYT